MIEARSVVQKQCLRSLCRSHLITAYQSGETCAHSCQHKCRATRTQFAVVFGERFVCQ